MTTQQGDKGELELGRARGSDDEVIRLPTRALLRHMMALGSSGSGKTVLSKVVVEEIVRAGIPALCLDPQGDLCSLALAAKDPEALAARGLDPAVARAFADRCEVVIFTPGSSKGVALGADPLAAIVAAHGGHSELAEIDEEVWTRAAATIAALLGYASDDDDGEGFIAVLDTILRGLADTGHPATSLRGLSDHLSELDDRQLQPYARFWAIKPLRQAIRKLARLEVGPRRKLFAGGVPLDIDLLLGNTPTPAGATAPGKIRVAIVHLNSLHQQEDKEFFVAAIAERLYAWMLARPSADPQLLFYLDEIAPYMPPVRKPQCKDSLQLLFKQARKYGVCCLMATQNPGDVDYRAMAQFGTWALGRLMTRQDLKKIEPTVKALAPADSDEIMAELPRLEPGQFVLLSPDHFPKPVGLRTRWLYTEHETLDEARIEALTDARWRARFAELVSPSKQKTKPKPKPKTEPEPEPEPPTTEPAPTSNQTIPGAPRGRESVKPDAPPRSAPSVEPTPATPKPSRQRPLAAAPASATPPPAVLASAPAPAAPASSAPLAPPKAKAPSKAELRELERQHELEVLRAHGPLDVKGFAARLGCGETKARRMLKRLHEGGRAGCFKQGRSAHYWALDTGARPDLEMPAQVLVATPGLSQDQAAILAQGHLRSNLLGLGSAAETLVNVSLIHALLWRVDFNERVQAGLLGRLVGPSHEQRMGSLYLHSHSLDVLSWDQSRGLRFDPRPAENASDVHDLDGLVRFTRLAPAGLRFDEPTWTTRRSEVEVRATVNERWATEITAVIPCFMPLWKLMIRRHEPAGMRVLTIDSVAGHLVEWPPTSPLS